MTDQCPLCDKDEAITNIREDVSYIRGRMESFVSIEERTKERLSSLETNARTQNIFGSIVAMALACVAWFKE